MQICNVQFMVKYPQLLCGIPQSVRAIMAGALVMAGAAHSSAATPSQPVIQEIQPHNSQVRIRASVPAGWKKITLETATPLQPANWQPRAIARIDGAAAVIQLEAPRDGEIQFVRVRADATELLPAFFFQGTNAFLGEVTAEEDSANRSVVLFNTTTGMEPNRLGAPTTEISDGAPAATRSVVESDIWKIEGQTLYFFNQYRGLQVIDIANPDAPVLRAQYALPGTGEQMYVLSPAHVVLLANPDYCGWSDGNNGSRILVIEVDGNQTRAAATVTVEGNLVESRMVGTALYTASQTTRPHPQQANTWET